MTDYEFNGAKDRQDFTARQSAMSDSEASGETQQNDLDWELAKEHREIISSMILASVQRKQGDICLLGAGPCNDIELIPMVGHFNRVVMVDWDLASMQEGLAKQEVLPDERFVQLLGADLAGVKDLLDVYARYPTPELMEQLKEAAEQNNPKLDSGKFSVVASTCILSQLMFKIHECVREKNEDFAHLMFNVRKRHIELMLDCLSPGGIGLLITDFVSSDSLPEILKTDRLQQVLQKGIKEQNFFHGMNPQRIHLTFGEESVRQQIDSLEVTSPWRWQTRRRVYACMAFKFQKKVS